MLPVRKSTRKRIATAKAAGSERNVRSTPAKKPKTSSLYVSTSTSTSKGSTRVAAHHVYKSVSTAPEPTSFSAANQATVSVSSKNDGAPVCNTKEKMATSCDICCDVCNGRDITNPAEHWCPECEEGLCSDCLVPHIKMKSTRYHRVVTIDNNKQLPSSVLKLTRKCDEHSKEYQIYCPDHECLCCPVCAFTTHKECTGLMPMDEAIKTSKTSVSLETLESAFTNIETNLQRAQTVRELNTANIVEQGREFHSEIKTLRSIINSHLDQIEETLHQELNTQEDKAKTQIQDALQKITGNRIKAKVIQQNLLAVKKYGSDIQTFLWSRTLEAEMIKLRKFIKSLAQDGSLQQIRLQQLEIDTKISDLSSIPIFGTISTQINPQSVVLKTDRGKQAPIMSAVGQARPKNISNINLILKSEFIVPKGKQSLKIYGSIICGNGKMIFSDTGNTRLVVLNDNGTLHKEITGIAGGPIELANIHDATNINDSTVVVTTNRDILIIDVDTGKIKETFNIGKHCFGIVHLDGHLFWCQLSKCIRMIELSSMNISNIVGKKAVDYWSYIAACNDKLYVTNMWTDAVTCYSTKGEKKWEYKSLSLRVPRCITVNTDSNVYVASDGMNLIMIISPDGKECRTLLSMTDINSQVWGIIFDKVRQNSNLLVICTDGSAFLYSVV